MIKTATRKTLTEIKNHLNEYFGDRIISLVLFGSSLREKNYEDLDLHLLLDEQKHTDLLMINKSIPESSLKIDLLISYVDELSGYDIFRIRNQGKYLLYSLAKGKIILGKNNFYRNLLLNINDNSIREDLYIKNKEYQNSLRDFLLERNILDKQKILAKYFIRYLTQILVLVNKLTYDEILKLNKNQLMLRIRKCGVLSEQEYLILTKMVVNGENNQEEMILTLTCFLYKLDQINKEEYQKNG